MKRSISHRKSDKTLREKEMIDLDSLERAALTATPGPWECQIPAMTGEWPTAKVKPLKIRGRLYGHPLLPIRDAAFIAAANPQVILELVARLRAAEALIDWAKANIPEMDCRSDEDCDHCYGLQVLSVCEELENVSCSSNG